MNDGHDLMSQMDDARDKANEINGRVPAVPIAAFYKTLKEGGVNDFTAGNITYQYAMKILGMGKQSG